MRIEVYIPARNEEAIIAESVEAIARVLHPIHGRVLVIDSASSDETAARATDAGATVLEVRVPGKGAAVIAAARDSDADIFAFADADLSADPDDIPAFIRHVESGAFDIVIGSRLIDTNIVQRSMVRTSTSLLFNMLRRWLLGIRAMDTQCGLKVMNRKGRAMLAQCIETGWFFDMEFLARAERAGLKILETPVHWDEHRFKGRKSKLSLVRDGFGAIAAMIRIRRRLMSQ
jgi:glycosyltransferase involved in cell wall biosynthesis